MPKLSFEIGDNLVDSLRGRGRLADYIQSQMLCNNFDMDVPHTVTHDQARRCLVVSQEALEEKEHPSEDSEVRGQRGESIH